MPDRGQAPTDEECRVVKMLVLSLRANTARKMDQDHSPQDISSWSTATGRLGMRRKVLSLVTMSAQPCNNAVATWIASGVLSPGVALSFAASSRIGCVMGSIRTSGV